MYVGKREDFGRRERKNEFEKRENIKMYRKCKKWPNISLFIGRVLSTCYLLYFFLFYKNEFYFTFYQMNK